MRARPGRLLPSVIAGGLLISGLALGAGTANAAQILGDGDSCTIAGIGDAVSLSGVVQGTDCVDSTTKLSVGSVASSVEEKAAQATAATKAAAEKAAAEKAAAEKAAAEKAEAEKAAGGTPTSDPKSTTGTTNSGSAATTTSAAPAAGAPAPLVAAPAAAPVLAPAALGAAPAGLLPPLAGVAPAGLASSLFSANTYDPGLLFGSPLGNAASGLFSPKADSDVTTVSQAQALASTSGGGYGTPATIGVIILACLIGFAVRHRIISRMKSREAAAGGYAPRHAAPEIEQIDPAESNDATEQVSIDDDDRTMVVLNRR